MMIIIIIVIITTTVLQDDSQTQHFSQPEELEMHLADRVAVKRARAESEASAARPHRKQRRRRPRLGSEPPHSLVAPTAAATAACSRFEAKFSAPVGWDVTEESEEWRRCLSALLLLKTNMGGGPSVLKDMVQRAYETAPLHAQPSILALVPPGQRAKVCRKPGNLRQKVWELLYPTDPIPERLVARWRPGHFRARHEGGEGHAGVGGPACRSRPSPNSMI